MREILFRGKRVDNGEWETGYYVRANYHWHKYGIHKDWIVTGACSNGGWFALHGRYPVISDSVGQYTGLKDKNGKQIFEGDIVRYGFLCDYNCYLESLDYPEDYEGCDFSNDIKITTVKWYGEGGCPAFDLENHDFESNGLSYMEAYDDCVIEVIGNIHDNPEMIGGKEDATV